MKDASSPTERRPCEWSIGYMAGLQDVFRRLDDMAGTPLNDGLKVALVRAQLAIDLGLSDDARALLKLPMR